MCDQSIGKSYTINEFFQNHNKICIPILQRDYAQGRPDKGYIREAFLKEIYETVNSWEYKTLTLDFVYGYSKDNCFYPLDGQQRLTTMWLVYWYLALKAGKLAEEKENLSKFTYETRKSSRQFCEALCKEEIVSREKGIVNYLTDQAWFYAEWKKDPTIQSMLRMIGGTGEKDGIEPVFQGAAKNSNKWGTLLQRFQERVSFYVLNIQGALLPEETADQLYVKMNARGKALTDFENFKADFIWKLQKDDKNLAFSISQKLDNAWNDIFWRSTNAGETDGVTDEIFFAFINRFCFSQLCVAKKNNDYVINTENTKLIEDIANEEDVTDVKKKQQINDLSKDEKKVLLYYDYLSNDHQISYESFAPYESILIPENVEKLDRVLNGIDKYQKEIEDSLQRVNRVVKRRLSDKFSEYRVIPSYQLDASAKKIFKKDKAGNHVGEIKETSLKERIYLYAICKYFEIIQSFQADHFEDWIRFSRNVIENAGISSQSAMISCMRKLDELGDHSDDIIGYLDSLSVTSGKSEMEKQIAEEIEKAKQVMHPKDRRIDWKEEIKKAEDHAFFCGCIRFLYAPDDITPDGWSIFSKKFETAKQYFRGNEVKWDFVKGFARQFHQFEDVWDKLIFHMIGWQERGDSWLEILCDPNLAKQVNAMLKDPTALPTVNLSTSPTPYEKFVSSNTFESVVKKTGIMSSKADLRISRYNNAWALYKKSAQDDKMYFDQDGFHRNEFLRRLTQQDSNYNMDDSQVFTPDEGYYWGEDIKIKYQSKIYVWRFEDYVNMSAKGQIVDYETIKGKLATIL